MTLVIYLWRVQRRHLLRSIWHMASDRRELKKDPTISFFKLIGTGPGETFTPRDADPTLWGLVMSIKNSDIDTFDEGIVVKRWREFATSEARFLATPISSHGRWSGQDPFLVDQEAARQWDGKVLALTRAKIRWYKNFQFWRAVPPVIESLRNQPGVELAIGIGEAPLGLQGTLSIWTDADSVRQFAFRGKAHSEVIRQTKARNWYSEELFARFALTEVRGSITAKSEAE